ncbi:nitroreductase family deazaflavin-dependent oxidoreductase [Nocardia arizonensis]|uniref:nitroreductase family deazaflavin-dependent oxidoreductase n=1 Tax=Nocardia arizonensis TaxID=1141647 RepID=UPI0006CF4143|nr:nitroreductase family deazaflavin-dependent oxidoreductase [Nocardia arizonensis]
MLSNPLPKVGRWLGTQPWVLRSARFVLPAERILRAVSGRRFGVLDLAGLPSMRITVAGRRSGLPRETSLLYVPRGEDFLVVGSNWGSPKHPVWSANLRAAQSASVRVRGRCFAVSVTELVGAERDRAWDAAVGFWPGYRVEERLAGGRRFRIFELRPSPR